MLFISLDTFLFTGGLEKFNRCFLKALQELSNEGFITAKAMAMYDKDCDEKYFNPAHYTAFKGNKLKCVLYSFLHSYKHKTIILGHVNLALIGLLIKLFNPAAKIILIVHGIDIWKPQTGLKKLFLHKVNEIWSVSHFTKNKMLATNSYLKANKIKIFPNTIDPYFQLPTQFYKPDYLLKRYGIDKHTKVLLTVTRLANTEQFKGYDYVIESLSKISKKDNISIKYLIGGKGQTEEVNRIENLIQQHKAQEQVQLLGFIKDEELIDHYLLADVFVMPSKKEGFGIVFIEAAACGCKVIAGNKDGSVDALQNGALGTLINPDSVEELEQAILENLNNNHHHPAALQQKVVNSFGFPVFKERLKQYLNA